ncbi:MAG: Rossmann-like and DUF2520 domain-containing protein [Lachnospiraceae bacterium]
MGIIGAGKVGSTMGKYITEHGGSVSGFYSRTTDSAKEAAQFCNTNYFLTLDSLIEVSDTLFITTPDGEIKKVWDCIATKNVNGKVVGHFSGSLSSDIFSNSEGTGAYVCSIHPIYAFSNKFTAYYNLTEAMFTVEGDDMALKQIQKLFCLLPNHVIQIATNAKTKYHAAASIASNHVTGLIAMSVELMQEAGIEESVAYEMLKPLVLNNMNTIFAQGCVEALTGPIERGDEETVRNHLTSLSQKNQQMAYQAVGLLVTKLAKIKHPDRKFDSMEQLLKEECK